MFKELQNLKKYETRERTLMRELIRQDKINYLVNYTFPEKILCYDVLLKIRPYATVYNYYTEIKVRDNKINEFESYFLERAKFDNLMKYTPTKGRILYINFFITDIENKWDYILFDVSRRVNDWKTSKNPPIPVRVMANERTFVSKEDKIPKEMLPLYFDTRYDIKDNFIIN